MTNDLQSVKEDISFMKALMVDDGNALVREGAVLCTVGVVFGLNALRLFALESGWLNLPAVLRHVIPWDAFIIFFIALAILLSRLPSLARSAGARATSSAWTAVGIGLGVAVVSLAAAGWRLGQPTLFLSVFPLVLFTLYGAAWSVAFSARRRTWFGGIAIGCYGTAIVGGMLVGTPAVWLVLALGLFFLIGLPGFLIMRQVRTETNKT